MIHTNHPLHCRTMTIRTAWASLIAMAAVLLEIWCGRLGLMIAAWPLAALYLGTALGIQWGVWFGLAACVSVEILLGRVSTSLPLVLGLFPLLHFWRRHGDRRYYLTQMLPAGIAGFAYCLWTLLAENWHGATPLLDLRWAAILLGAGTAATAIGGPLLWRLLDIGAIPFGLPRFYQRSGVRAADAPDEDPA